MAWSAVCLAPNATRCASAGDCAAMSGDNDSIWLQQGNRGRELLFSLDDDELQPFEAVNTAGANEMPSYVPGKRVWLLER